MKHENTKVVLRKGDTEHAPRSTLRSTERLPCLRCHVVVLLAPLAQKSTCGTLFDMHAIDRATIPAKNRFEPHTIQGAVPGSYKVLNLPASEYHSQVDVQSCSMLKHMLESPAVYMHRLLRCAETSSKSKEFGTLVHTLCLEPHKFFSEVAIYPGAKKSQGVDRAFLEFQRDRPGMHVIDEPTHVLAKSAVDRLKNQVVMGRKFGDFIAEGEPEATVYYTDPTVGIKCRTRVDLLHPEGVFDVKTTAYAHTPAWIRHALSLHYDMQAYMYSLAVCLQGGNSTALPFVFMTVENTWPLSTAARRAGVTILEDGGRKYQHAIAAYKACSDSDAWPCAGGEEVLELEHWQHAALDHSWLSHAPLPSRTDPFTRGIASSRPG